MNEQKIVINGYTLSDGQVQTLRTALGCLKLDLHQEPVDRTFGKREVAQHLASLDELAELIGGLTIER